MVSKLSLVNNARSLPTCTYLNTRKKNHRQTFHLNYTKDNILKIFQILHGLDKCDMLLFILVF